jgi:GNAT superfamily N-acetyltransferase
MSLEIRRTAADAPDAAALIAAMVAEINTLYGGNMAGPGMPSATPADFAPPGGAFLVVYDDGRPVAGGGVKTLAPGIGEIKRMYVAEDARGRGLARKLLTALEDAARACGHDMVRLDTGPAQPHARTLYESAGYRAIPDYNDNPFAAFWGEKAL